MKKRYLFIVLLLWNLTVSAQFSIEQILSAPFPSHLTAGPDGNTLAWVFNDRGERNIFVADGPQFGNVRQVTNYSGDEGVEISSLTYTPDGRQLIYVRGNGNNKSGDPANPAQLQQSTGYEIFIVSLFEGGAPRAVAEGNAPYLSPNGKTLLFLKKGQVWTIDPADANAKATQLFQARGSQGDLRWQPKGNKLAFVSRRGDHAFIGMYDFDSKQVTYPDPSADLDGEPVWSPDGHALAYVRRPNVQALVPFTPRRQGSPWSIRLLDMASGKAKEIWRADGGPGSVFVGNLPVTENKLLWADGNRLIFPWEKSGWVQLYALDIQRELPKPLMWGDGEVENVVLSADRKTLFYTTNVSDLHRRHIWKVDVAKGQPEPLMEGDHIEWSPVPTANGVALLRSSATRPAWPAYYQAGKVKDLATGWFPKDFPRALVTPEVVTVKATDGMEVKAQLFLPPGHQSGQQYPAVIFLHGGSRRQMLNGFHYSSYYSNAYALNQYFASKGYVVMALNYRSGIGYGLNFREAEDYASAVVVRSVTSLAPGNTWRPARMWIPNGLVFGAVVTAAI
ncbi:MAG: DPP IV N-terminal domain-containing protein [Saprospiraceae bacterium]